MGVFTDSIVVELFEGSDNPFGIYRAFEFHSGEPDSGLFLSPEAGFRFNGTSIPFGLRWLINPADPDLLQCAAGHDWVFQRGYVIIRVNGAEKKVPVHRDVANALMAEMMIAKKVKKWKRSLINPGLALFSGYAWRKWEKVRGDDAMRTATTQF